MREIYIEIARLLIMIMCAAITRYLIPWIKAKTENSIMQSLIDWTGQAVMAAEQTHDAGSGEEKKAIVTKFIKQLLMQKNIALSDAEIEMLIEAAVLQLKLDDGTVAVN